MFQITINNWIFNFVFPDFDLIFATSTSSLHHPLIDTQYEEQSNRYSLFYCLVQILFVRSIWPKEPYIYFSVIACFVKIYLMKHRGIDISIGFAKRKKKIGRDSKHFNSKARSPSWGTEIGLRGGHRPTKARTLNACVSIYIMVLSKTLKSS